MAAGRSNELEFEAENQKLRKGSRVPAAEILLRLETNSRRKPLHRTVDHTPSVVSERHNTLSANCGSTIPSKLTGDFTYSDGIYKCGMPWMRLHVSDH